MAPAFRLTVVEVPEAAGENDAVAPAGNPEALKLTDPAKPFVPLMVSASLPLAPCATLTLGVAGDIEKPAAAVTLRVMVVAALAVPDTPVIEMG